MYPATCSVCPVIFTYCVPTCQEFPECLTKIPDCLQMAVVAIFKQSGQLLAKLNVQTPEAICV